jgi:hypothetical protein
MSLYEIIEPEIDFISVIENNCKEIMEDYRFANKYLFRGIKRIDSIILGESPTNRKPVDMNIRIQSKIDDNLKNSGFKALRSNSIFCSSSYSTAKYYGYDNPYIIFPFDGFDFTYANGITDFFEQVGLTGNIWFELEDLNFVSNFGFEKTNLPLALDKCYEVYIHGKYIAVKCTAKNTSLMEKLLGINVQNK